MTDREALEVLSFTSKRYNYFMCGRADGKSKHIEALKTVKERLERLEKLEKALNKGLCTATYLGLDGFEHEELQIDLSEEDEEYYVLKKYLKEENVLAQALPSTASIEAKTNYVHCPLCNSINIRKLFGTGTLTTTKNLVSYHYICEDCKQEFEETFQ